MYILATARHFRGFTFLVALLITISNALSQSNDSLNVVENLTLRFLRLGQTGELVLNTEITQSNAIGCYISEKEDFDRLFISDNTNFSIWIDGQLIQSNEKTFNITKESLFEGARNDTKFISVVSTNPFSNLTAYLLAADSKKIGLINLPISKKEHYFQDWLIISVLILLASVGTMRIWMPSMFRFLFTMDSLATREENVASEFNFESLLSTLFVSLAIGFLFNTATLMDSDKEIISNAYLYLDWFKSSFVIFFALLAKYILLTIVAWLNAISKVVNIQYHTFLKAYVIGALVLILISLAHYWTSYYSGFHIFGWVSRSLFVIYFIYLIYLFQKLLASTHCKKLHIISYLCTTEFIGAFLIALIIYK